MLSTALRRYLLITQVVALNWGSFVLALYAVRKPPLPIGCSSSKNSTVSGTTVFGYCVRIFSPYHLKTAFFHFQRTETNWKAEQLATRFLGLLQYIHHCVMKRELLHFFTPRNNLLSDYKDATFQNIQRRLLEITTSEKKLLSCL